MGHKLPLIVPVGKPSAEQMASLYANLNCYALDYVARQKVGGISMTYFYLKQFSVLPPSVYNTPRPWIEGKPLRAWIAPRVLELTYTAWDMQPFARDMGYNGPPFAWDPERRFQLRCELDAAFFHLYGIGRDDAAYILDTFVRPRDIANNAGAFKAKEPILAIYDAMAAGGTRTNG